MIDNSVAAIILAAGKGTRMKSDLHKVLHPVGGRPMISHLIATLTGVGVDQKVVVTGSGRDQVEAALGDVDFAVQDPQLGTGHAVKCTKAALAGFKGTALILYGDVPLVSAAVMQSMLDARAMSMGGMPMGAVVLGFRPDDAAAYGRLLVDGDGYVERIVEFKDANEAERAVDFCNSGIMAVDAEDLFTWLDEIDNDNAAGEYYLTDIVKVARDHGRGVVAIEAPESEVLGVNSREDLALAEAYFQEKARRTAMQGGATLLDPATVWFSWDTQIGSDVTVEPNVFFGPGVTVGSGATIRAHSHIAGATIGEGSEIGPFARLRPGAELGSRVKVGNFCEVKKATVGEGAKINHLSYIGDATIGANANIGAGTITCNYDGFGKFQTTIGEGAFIGSNTALVAPVTIGNGASIGAGSTINKDVEADDLSLTRAPQKSLKGWAAKFRAKRSQETGK